MEKVIKRLEVEEQLDSQRQLITMQRQQQMLEQQGKMAMSQGQQQSAHMLQQQQQRQPVRSNPTSAEQHIQQPQRSKQEQPEATIQYRRQTEIIDLTTPHRRHLYAHRQNFPTQRLQLLTHLKDLYAHG